MGAHHRTHDEAALTIAQDQPGPPYRLVLPIEVRGADGKSARHEVRVDAAQQTVEIETEFKVDAVRCDPDDRLPVETVVDC